MTEPLAEVRALGPGDAVPCFALRREALLDAPLAFASSPEDDVASSPEALRRLLDQAPDAVTFGAFEATGESGAARLVGMVGIGRDRHRKASHRAHLWGMYVTPAARGRGRARALLTAAVAHARGLPGLRWLVLGVGTEALAALHLYRSAGFEVWGTECDALRVGDRSVDEHHMALSLVEDPIEGTGGSPAS